ncbi:proteasome stabiliser-domain-containing protein [Cokeromyces recurvatus]|uniref:proteasome stabiliser-domain-containing protein n=1 Tax=Cokeromyces recurvatus TaxID=90255 RepID=UPI00222017A2|nr:proteasome stabiliser-domain-containing protein [Cokeromyces recurvatus]KAI7902114.1 proteasome stabiliser-domain-containing protein [Cokeromyces recurvatus]
MSNEVQLLENVELKLAMCNTDAQLEKTIQTFLPPVLLKLASNNPDAKRKVMEILSHINKRVKTNNNIRLPFEALLNQFTDPLVSTFVKNFTLIYLEMATSRMSREETAQHLPAFLTGISLRPVQQRIPLLHIVLYVLNQWEMDHEVQLTARQTIFHFDQHPKDVSIILNFFLDVMLYQPLTARDRMAEQQQDENNKQQGLTNNRYPGLSEAAVEDVTNKGKINWTTSKLKDAKLGIMKLILTPIFTDSERLPLLIVGICDANHQVVSVCEDGIRRWTGNVDYEDKATIQSLYRLYLGTATTKSGNTTESNKDIRSQASNSVKLRILQYLSKSIIATQLVTSMIQVIFDGIYGDMTTAKLQRNAMSFLQWCARMSTNQHIGPVAPIIISGLLKFIKGNEEMTGLDAESIKGYAYVACGLVVKKVPKVGLSDTQILSLFFDNLEKEQKNVRSYIQDALSSMIEVYVDLPCDSPIYENVQNIILKAVQKNDPYSRYMALKYANAIYPFSSVFARYVCLLGCSLSVTKLDVKEEAHRGLTPFVRNKYGLVEHVDVIPVTELPRFTDLVYYIHSHRPDQEFTRLSKTPVINGYPVEVYAEMLNFLRMIWILESNHTHLLIDQYVAEKVDNSMSEDPVTMTNFKKSVIDKWTSNDEKQAVQYWLDLIENGLNLDLKDSICLITSAKCLLEIISLGPSSIATSFQDRLDFFKSLALSEKLDARQSMSHIFGIIASSSDNVSQLETILTEFCNLLETPAERQVQPQRELDQQHGAVLSIGYLISRSFYRNLALSDELYHRSVIHLIRLLNGSPSASFYMMANAACQSLSEIGRTKRLPLTMEKSQDGSMDLGITVQDVIETLIKLATTCKEAKVQEKAILALGHLSIPLLSDNSMLVQKVIDGLYSTADTKQVELAFTCGEAWSIIGFGWESGAMQKYKDMDEIPLLKKVQRANTSIFEGILDKIMRSYVASNRTWYRKAACIWLLSILKFGKDDIIVKKNLNNIHASFSRLLSDRDDFTQECASKGLGLVYEYGDKKIKEDMLYSLVGTFTEGRQLQAQSVTDNTILFDEGTLGETPDGNSITTYKELCSLASELNQPDLIYKFMNLANHNAMWTSRRGAAFGFQNLMVIAEKEMEPYLPRLIPKLYRYQFDPNARVNQTMKTIWRSLVKDSQKTVDLYFKEIMEDVLTGLGNRQWRIREASCVALVDLITGGRSLSQIEPYLERLWQMCFRALDDIKESVRQAATQTCRSLTKMTVHYCDPSTVAFADGMKAMNIVMPFLLEKGIVSDAEDVRKFSLDAVLKVCKTGAALLKKFVPELVDTLLQSLSSLEPQAMNYLSFHVDKYNISQEQLDNARLAGAKNSPMMEGIEHCIQQIDDEVMEKLTPRILHIIRKGTGLPTKAGCARFIVSLVMNRRSVFKPYADAYLKALSGTIKSKNPVIRKSYATAIGYVCQLASYDRLISLVKHLRKLYIDEEDEDTKAGSAVTTVEITRFATDRANSIATSIVPLIFFGEHDPEENLNKLWKAAWENLTSGTRSQISLYGDEILEFLQPLLSSSSWKVRQTAALTLADMCKISGQKNVQVYADKLLPILVSALTTRSWAGKENVLDAFVELCIPLKERFIEGSTVVSLTEVTQIMVREAKRKNRAYQRYALTSLIKFSDNFGDKLDLLSLEQGLLTELCEMDETKVMEEDDDGNENVKPLLLMIKANAFKALVSAYHPQIFPAEQEGQSGSLCNMLTNCLEGNVWNVQLAILQSLKKFVEQTTPTTLQQPDIIQNLLKASFDALTDMKYSAIRSAAVDVLEQLISNNIPEEAKKQIVQNINQCLQKENIALIKDRLQKLLIKI